MNNIEKTPYGINQEKINNINIPYENPIIHENNQTQDYSTNPINTIADKPLLILDEPDYDEDEYFNEEVKKTNLLFEEKQVSAFKLYCHLLLMIVKWTY